MQRVLVIGPAGAGKTTLSTAIADAIGLPLIHLDSLYWDAGWVPTPQEEWEAQVSEIVRQPRWIMDGNYGGTLDIRIAAADTIIFLDLPRGVCIWRLLKRLVYYRGRSRVSVAEGCPEQLSLSFLWWVWTYRRRRRPAILERLAGLEGKKQIVVRRSAKDVAAYQRLLIGGCSEAEGG